MLKIDCDCHNGWVNADILLPYLEPVWQDYMRRGERPGPGMLPNAHRPWLHPEHYARRDLKILTNEDVYPVMKEKHLDPHGFDHVILTGECEIDLSCLANFNYASALVAAYNDHLIADWLQKDDRLYGSLIIAPQNPQMAAQEIRRVGDHPRIVQVLASHGAQKPYGDPFYHPIYEACAEMGLPFAIHLGGQGGINAAPVGSGNPTYFWETHANLCQPAMTHVSSMIANGVFERRPSLKFVVIECGTAWVAPLMWRLDAAFKSLRKETPWLKRLPSEYMKSNIRFSTQPLDDPGSRDHLWSSLDAMDGRNTLMFASDYPHWDYDDVSRLNIPEDWKPNVLGLNALETYTRVPREKDAAE